MLEIPWYVFALMGAFLVSLGVLFEKDALRHEEPLHFSASATVSIGLLSLPFLFFVHWEALTLPILGLVGVTAILSTISFCLVAYSLKQLEAGEQSLILSLTPVATAALAFLFLGETLSVTASVGVVLVVVGLIVLEFPSLKTAAFHQKAGAVAITMVSVVVYGSSAVLDRILVGGYDMRAIDMLVLTQAIQLLIFIIYGVASGRHDRLLSASLLRQPGKIIAFSVLMFLSRISYLQAVSMAYIALVAALKRSGALFTIVMARVYLNERQVGHKLLAAAILLSGVLAIVL